MEIHFAPMQMEHIDEVVAIERRSFATPWSREAFVQELLNNEMALYMVALHEGRVVGYCGIWCIIDEGHITTLAVHPDYRRRKIGEYLLSAVIQMSKLRGAERVTLEVRVSNEEAKALYYKLGFVPNGIRRGYYADNKEDAIIMWKEDI